MESREPRVHRFLQRLDLARQAAVLAVDEHGDQGGIWLAGLWHHHPNSSTFIPAIPASATPVTVMTTSSSSRLPMWR